MQKSRRPNASGQVEGIAVCLPVFYAEAPPSLRGTTQGTIDRMKTVRFGALSAAKRSPEMVKEVKDPQSNWYKNMFVWMLLGAIGYLKNGIPQTPREIADENEATLNDADPLMGYIKSNMSLFVGKTSAEIADSYNQFRRAQGKNGEKDVTSTGVGRALGRLGWERSQERQIVDGSTKQVWVFFPPKEV